MWVAPEVVRVDEPFVAGERAMLAAFLELQRSTFLVKCAGLSGEQLAMRSVPPSAMSLLGLLRHLTDVDRHWTRRRFRGLDLPSLYWRDDCEKAAFIEAEPASAEADYARLLAEWELSRAALEGCSPGATFEDERWGTMSLRWLYQHLIDEYARHNGHADLLRERIDGTTGT